MMPTAPTDVPVKPRNPQKGVLTTFVGNPPFSPGGLAGKPARASRVGPK